MTSPVSPAQPLKPCEHPKQDLDKDGVCPDCGAWYCAPIVIRLRKQPLPPAAPRAPDWWITFEQMLTDEQRERIGLSRDRGANLCITRLCAALTEAEEAKSGPAPDGEVGELVAMLENYALAFEASDRRGAGNDLRRAAAALTAQAAALREAEGHLETVTQSVWFGRYQRASRALLALGCRMGEHGEWLRPCQSFYCCKCAVAGINKHGIPGPGKNCDGSGWLPIVGAAKGEGET